jgi:hypothetical protein
MVSVKLEPNVEVSAAVSDSRTFNIVNCQSDASLFSSTTAGISVATNFRLNLHCYIWIGFYGVVNYLPLVTCNISSGKSASSVKFPLPTVQNPVNVRDENALSGAQQLIQIANHYGKFDAQLPDDNAGNNTINVNNKADVTETTMKEYYQVKDSMIFNGYHGMEIKDIVTVKPVILPFVVTSISQTLFSLPGLLGLATSDTKAEDKSEDATSSDNSDSNTEYSTNDATIEPCDITIDKSSASLEFSSVKLTVCSVYKNDEHKKDNIIGKKYAWKGKATLKKDSKTYESSNTADIFSYTVLNGCSLSKAKGDYVTSEKISFKNSSDSTDTQDYTFVFRILKTSKDGNDDEKEEGKDLTIQSPVLSDGNSKYTSDTGSSDVTIDSTAGSDSISNIVTNTIKYDSSSDNFSPYERGLAAIGSDYAVVKTKTEPKEGKTEYTADEIKEIFYWMKGKDFVADTKTSWEDFFKNNTASTVTTKILGYFGINNVENLVSDKFEAYQIKFKGSDDNTNEGKIKCARIVNVEESDITVDPKGYTLNLSLDLLKYDTKYCFHLIVDKNSSSVKDYRAFKFSSSIADRVEPNIILSNNIQKLFTTQYAIYASKTSYDQVGISNYCMALDFFKFVYNDVSDKIEFWQIPAVNTEEINKLITNDSRSKNVFKCLSSGAVTIPEAFLAGVGTGLLGITTKGTPQLLFDANKDGNGTFYSFAQKEVHLKNTNAAGKSGIKIAKNKLHIGAAKKITIKAGNSSITIGNDNGNNIIELCSEKSAIKIENDKITLSIGTQSAATLSDKKFEIAFNNTSAFLIDSDSRKIKTPGNGTDTFN